MIGSYLESGKSSLIHICIKLHKAEALPDSSIQLVFYNQEQNGIVQSCMCKVYEEHMIIVLMVVEPMERAPSGTLFIECLETMQERYLQRLSP